MEEEQVGMRGVSYQNKDCQRKTVCLAGQCWASCISLWGNCNFPSMLANSSNRRFASATKGSKKAVEAGSSNGWGVACARHSGKAMERLTSPRTLLVRFGPVLPGRPRYTPAHHRHQGWCSMSVCHFHPHWQIMAQGWCSCMAKSI